MKCNIKHKIYIICLSLFISSCYRSYETEETAEELPHISQDHKVIVKKKIIKNGFGSYILGDYNAKR